MTRHRNYSRQAIEAEYDVASDCTSEFAKVKWASQDGMLNRFRLAVRMLPFAEARTWLDVGCGTGAFEAMVRSSCLALRITAIDISPRLLEYCRSRPDTIGVDFRYVDFAELNEGYFDIITCIGVLQKTCFSPATFFAQAARRLAAGGCVYVDSKHAGWQRFRKRGFVPDPSHEWFSETELRDGATAAGLTVTKFGGFLPDADRVVEPEESHTVFLIAEKRS